jgi:hypothetical protein
MLGGQSTAANSASQTRRPAGKPVTGSNPSLGALAQRGIDLHDAGVRRDGRRWRAYQEIWRVLPTVQGRTLPSIHALPALSQADRTMMLAGRAGQQVLGPRRVSPVCIAEDRAVDREARLVN